MTGVINEDDVKKEKREWRGNEEMTVFIFAAAAARARTFARTRVHIWKHICLS